MSNAKGNSGGRQKHTATPEVDESLLKAEISFWQELIRFRDATTSDESLERMQQALTLAQTRLGDALTKDHTRMAPNHPTGNVYFIENRKNTRKI